MQYVSLNCQVNLLEHSTMNLTFIQLEERG
jgi:hypothetical protein